MKYTSAKVSLFGFASDRRTATARVLFLDHEQPEGEMERASITVQLAVAYEPTETIGDMYDRTVREASKLLAGEFVDSASSAGRDIEQRLDSALREAERETARVPKKGYDYQADFEEKKELR